MNSHVDIWQKQTQHCKAFTNQLKMNKLKTKNELSKFAG